MSAGLHSIQKNRIGLTFIDAAEEPRANKQR